MMGRPACLAGSLVIALFARVRRNSQEQVSLVICPDPETVGVPSHELTALLL